MDSHDSRNSCYRLYVKNNNNDAVYKFYELMYAIYYFVNGNVQKNIYI